MSERFQVVSPIDGSVYAERELSSLDESLDALAAAHSAQRAWSSVPLEGRQALLEKAVELFLEAEDELAQELTWQIGRPIAHSPSEIRTFADRARTMITLAGESLADVQPPALDGHRRFIRRVPLGVVVVLAPWNYPYLTSVNAIVPALLAGNTVLLKHSHQTPLCAERYGQFLDEAGLPEGVFQYLHITHEDTARLLRDDRIAHVCFTGSVEGGRSVQRALGDRFVAPGLELGGKDPAYVRADADLEQAIAGIVDGAYFNSGQSCCAIERAYVHETLFDSFVSGCVDTVRQYRLGDPRDPATTLGPVVRAAAAEGIRAQVQEAVENGARALIDPAHFPAAGAGTPYLAPQVLVDVDHTHRVMIEETFGPVLGIMPVRSDEEALRLMNDSPYGLTASIWTRDEEAALRVGRGLETGTVFMNRCDYLDPYLAWTGVKLSGRGCTLSRIGFEQLTRPKSFHFRLPQR